MFTVITAGPAKMGWWKSKANPSHTVQPPCVLCASGPIGSAGRGRHIALPRGRFERLGNYQLWLKACTLWSFSLQTRVGPTEIVKPSHWYRVHPCNESCTLSTRQVPLAGLRCRVFTVSGAWSHQRCISYASAAKCATCPGEQCDTLGCHSPFFPSRRAASRRLETGGP